MIEPQEPLHVTEPVGALAVAATTLALAVARLAWTAHRHDASSPGRLVAELRLAQVSALLLVLAAGTYAGAAVVSRTPGAGLDIALATGFLVVAALATTWAPGRALTVLALAWGAHGLLALGHQIGLLPPGTVPAWYSTASAIYAVCMAGVCYLPNLRQR